MFDFVIFHTPENPEEAKEVYLVVDELAGDEDVTSMLVMEIHQTIPIPCVNTFRKRDFKLFYRPSEDEVDRIKSGKSDFKSIPQI